jgi:hypothetical protein
LRLRGTRGVISDGTPVAGPSRLRRGRNSDERVFSSGLPVATFVEVRLEFQHRGRLLPLSGMPDTTLPIVSISPSGGDLGRVVFDCPWRAVHHQERD